MNIASAGPFAVSRMVWVMLLSFMYPFTAFADQSGQGRVAGATVYPDRALVVRSLDVDLVPGPMRVEMVGLPAGLDQDSLRIRARGPAGLVLEGFETRMESAQEVDSPEYHAAETELRELLDQQRKFKDDLGTIKSQREFLDGIQIKIPEEIGKSLTAGEIRPEDWQEAFGFLGRNLSDLAERERKINREKPDLDRKIGAARDRLRQMRSKGQTRTLTAIAALRSPSGGKGELRVEYLTGPASWYPVYEARFDPRTEEVEFVEKAMVKQETGEDWEGIDLTLSTARPGSPLDIPEIEPLPLFQGKRARNQNQEEFSDEFIEGLPVIGRDYRETLDLEPEDTDGDGNVVVDGVNLNATEREYGGKSGGFVNIVAASPGALGSGTPAQTVVTYSISTPQDVPSDGQYHRYGIGIQTLELKEKEFRAAPRFQEGVFLRTKVVNSGDHPLLQGKVVSFDGPNLLGSSILEERAPGEEFTVPFGPDPKFRTERRRLSRVVDSDRRTTKVTYHFLTSIQMFRGEDRQVTLEDRIPVSENDAITVRLLGDTTPGFEEDPEIPGLLRWNLTVRSQEPAEVRLAYEVRFPTGWYLPNLE